jgi:hypothetical protein
MSALAFVYLGGFLAIAPVAFAAAVCLVMNRGRA